jgi:hypothetical protein
MSAELTQTQSLQYPAAHLGHLTASQETALAEFKKLSEEKGFYKSKVEGKDVASHDDETMLYVQPLLQPRPAARPGGWARGMLRARTPD